MKTGLLLLLLTGFFQPISQAQSKTYILVHGGWHGAWCWKKVVPLLEAKNNRVLAVDLPGHGDDKTPVATVTLDDYVQKIAGVANTQRGPVILVGHSMAGVAIAQAAEVLGQEKVAKLVFLDAFMPKNGESVFALAGKAGFTAQFSNLHGTGLSHADGRFSAGSHASAIGFLQQRTDTGIL